MATATFRFHGEFADFIARERRGVAFDYACARAATIKHAIESLCVPHSRAVAGKQPSRDPLRSFEAAKRGEAG